METIINCGDYEKSGWARVFAKEDFFIKTKLYKLKVTNHY